MVSIGHLRCQGETSAFLQTVEDDDSATTSSNDGEMFLTSVECASTVAGVSSQKEVVFRGPLGVSCTLGTLPP